MPEPNETEVKPVKSKPGEQNAKGKALRRDDPKIGPDPADEVDEQEDSPLKTPGGTPIIQKDPEG